MTSSIKTLFTFFLVFSALSLYQVKSDEITVHIIPHTHDDLGWVLTIQEYYDQRVKNILDSMMISLANDDKRTFSYVEIGFFNMWYPSQLQSTKDTLKNWLSQGRFEFVMGAWTMQDESASYFQHIIDQARLGLQFLKKEFNYTPKIGWFIDPFGHSATNAMILKELGYEKIVFVRIDDKEKNIRRNQKTLEFNWFPYKDLATTPSTSKSSSTEYYEKSIFTHITYEHYCPFSNFGELNYDILLNWDETTLTLKAKEFADNVKRQNTGYMHDQLIFWLGCDFSHQKANLNFQNMEAIMNKINLNPTTYGMKLIYSTPSKYFSVVDSYISSKKLTLPTYYNNDFFPYADGEFDYWTGYFTSRPNLKVKIRETGLALESASNVLVETLLNKNKNKTSLANFSIYYNLLLIIRDKLGVNQHHDAVAGTCKNYVGDDYEKMLDEIKANVINQVIAPLLLENAVKKSTINENETVTACVQGYSNSSCDANISTFGANNAANLVIYNNHISSDNYVLKIKLKDPKVELFDSTNIIIPSDILCQPVKTNNTPEFPCTLYASLKLEKTKSFYRMTIKKIIKDPKINFTDMKSLDNKFSLFKNTKFSILHSEYLGYNGTECETKGAGQNNDGAYIFSTQKLLPTEMKLLTGKDAIGKNSLEWQKSLEYEKSYIHVRKFKNQNFLEVESVIDPNDEKDYTNKLLHIKSNIQNNVTLKNGSKQPEFWTDGNGLKMIRRIKDFRKSYDYKVTEKVAANFYPVNYSASIREKYFSNQYFDNDYLYLDSRDRTLTVFNERPQSVGAMNQGELMFILERTSQNDDNKGKGEAIYEHTSSTKYYSFYHYISQDKTNENSIFDLIHHKPAYFNLADNTDDIVSDSYLRNIVTTDCLINTHIISETEFLIQLYNRSDPYFTYNRVDCNYKYNKVTDLTYSVKEVSKNGVETIKYNGENEMNLLNLKYLNSDNKLFNNSNILKDDVSGVIESQNFKLFSITLN